MRIPGYFLAAIVALAPPVASAQLLGDFYRGKQLQFIIRAAPGGNYDLYLRLLARHIVRYIPGNPTALPMNMPGGGGLTALNYFDKVAAHDGTAITMVTQTAAMDQALGTDRNLKVDMGRLNWLGNMSDENLFLVTKRRSPTKTFDDAKRRETTLSATGVGGSEVILASVLNNVFGTRLKNILGYRSSPEMNLAMERGETEGRLTTNLRALFASTAGGAGSFNVVLQIGLRRDRNFPGVPLMRELARGQNERMILDFISSVMALGRPVATTDSVPSERVAALRHAFDESMQDPDFLAEAKQQDLDISPWTGEDLTRVVRSILDTPMPALDQIRRAIQVGAASEERTPRPGR